MSGKSYGAGGEGLFRREGHFVLLNGRVAIGYACRAVDFDDWVRLFLCSDDKSAALCGGYDESEVSVGGQVVVGTESECGLLNTAVVVKRRFRFARGIPTWQMSVTVV